MSYYVKTERADGTWERTDSAALLVAAAQATCVRDIPESGIVRVDICCAETGRIVKAWDYTDGKWIKSI
jgi:hypothetical protein